MQQRQFNEPEYDKFIAAEPGQSSWPHEAMALRAPKPRRTLDFYAIDLDDETVMKVGPKSNPADAARALQEQYPSGTVDVRSVYLTEEDMQVEDQARKKEQWATILFKPSPVRRQ